LPIAKMFMGHHLPEKLHHHFLPHNKHIENCFNLSTI
jgi:hypothetical protein